uniref:ATP synthase F(0) complex subunit f, mitochondrial n=1 Tax=Tursiops truncatus TaxID=9739 RepID=A0A6J3Q605_TURTR|nr:ATP synthase subunit f, mitochondrial-like [Tursiops truncatus]
MANKTPTPLLQQHGPPGSSNISGMALLQDLLLVVPVEKKLMDVKIKDLPNWILTQDFTPKGTIRAFQRGYYQYDNKYVNINKGSTLGVSMVLEADVLFNYCVSYKELKHEQLRKNH